MRSSVLYSHSGIAPRPKRRRLRRCPGWKRAEVARKVGFRVSYRGVNFVLVLGQQGIDVPAGHQSGFSICDTTHLMQGTPFFLPAVPPSRSLSPQAVYRYKDCLAVYAGMTRSTWWRSYAPRRHSHRRHCCLLRRFAILYELTDIPHLNMLRPSRHSLRGMWVFQVGMSHTAG